MIPSTNPQVTGSNLTYFKRYNLCGLFNIAEEDDDGDSGRMASQQVATHAMPAPASAEDMAALTEYHDAELMNEAQAKWFTAGHITEAQAQKALTALREKVKS